MPMSASRVTALAAELVCSVLNTRWPVKRGLDGHVGRLAVADFADHHHVGIVPQHAPQGLAEADLVGRVDLDLGHARDVVLDRVFDGHDVLVPAGR